MLAKYSCLGEVKFMAMEFMASSPQFVPGECLLKKVHNFSKIGVIIQSLIRLERQKYKSFGIRDNTMQYII